MGTYTSNNSLKTTYICHNIDKFKTFHLNSYELDNTETMQKEYKSELTDDQYSTLKNESITINGCSKTGTFDQLMRYVSQTNAKLSDPTYVMDQDLVDLFGTYLEDLLNG